MNNRFEFSSTSMLLRSLRFLNYTSVNIVAAFVTMPLAFFSTTKQLPKNTQSYFQLMRYMISVKGLRQIYSAPYASTLMTAKHSVFYFGLGHSILNYYDQDPYFLRGIKAGLGSALPESWAVTSNARDIVLKWMEGTEVPYQEISPDIAYPRCFKMTLLRNSIANTLTYTSYLYVKSGLEKYYGTTHPALNAVAGWFAGLLTNPFIMPFINTQTRVQAHPEIPIFQHVKTIYKESPRHFYRGLAGRVAHKSVHNLISFGLLGVCNNSIERYTNKLEPERRTRTIK